MDTEGQRISPELSNDFQKLFSESDDPKFPHFMKLFWQEQQKYKQYMYAQLKNAWYTSAHTWNKTWKNIKPKRQKTEIKVKKT